MARQSKIQGDPSWALLAVVVDLGGKLLLIRHTRASSSRSVGGDLMVGVGCG